MFFFCPSSRAVWFGSRLNLRIEGIAMSFIRALRAIMEGKAVEDQRYVANVLWCIWKARNSEIIEGIRVNPYKVCLQAAGMNTDKLEPPNVKQPTGTTYLVRNNQTVSLVDASWDVSGKAGMGGITYDHGGEIRKIKYCHYSAGDDGTLCMLKQWWLVW
jgi:hypothetical protein